MQTGSNNILIVHQFKLPCGLINIHHILAHMFKTKSLKSETDLFLIFMVYYTNMYLYVVSSPCTAYILITHVFNCSYSFVLRHICWCIEFNLYTYLGLRRIHLSISQTFYESEFIKISNFNFCVTILILFFTLSIWKHKFAMIL